MKVKVGLFLPHSAILPLRFSQPKHLPLCSISNIYNLEDQIIGLWLLFFPHLFCLVLAICGRFLVSVETPFKEPDYTFSFLLLSLCERLRRHSTGTWRNRRQTQSSHCVFPPFHFVLPSDVPWKLVSHFLPAAKVSPGVVCGQRRPNCQHVFPVGFVRMRSDRCGGGR